ncbi:MAG: hypothetical protein O2942_09110 [Proteobacteria bacterium]|nr:hypothetical protein [Pseudomonadota bacterium]
MELITQSQWAKRSGFSRQYASQLVKNGTVRNYDGKINPVQADKALEAMRNPAHTQKRVSEQQQATVTNAPKSKIDNTDLSEILLRTRIKNEIEKGKLLQSKVQSELGELLDAEEVRVAAFNKARVVRDGILNFADRLASVVTACNDEKKNHETIMKETRMVLEALSNE